MENPFRRVQSKTFSLIKMRLKSIQDAIDRFKPRVIEAKMLIINMRMKNDVSMFMPNALNEKRLYTNVNHSSWV